MKKSSKLILGAAATAAGSFAAYYGLGALIDEVLFNRKLVPPEKLSQKIAGCDTGHLGDFLEKNLQWLEDYGYEEHYIVSDSGYRLKGILLKAETPSDIYLFGAHGYRSYGKKEFCGVAQYYLKKGINVFLPDHVASGESEGSYCTFGYHEVRDCFKWLSYLKDNFGESIKIILHGVSMGSATVMMMGGSSELCDNVKMIVADCGFTTAKSLFASKLHKMGIPSTFLIGATSFAHEKRKGFSFDLLSPVESVKNIKLPILFVHGKADNLVPCSMAQELYESCQSEKKRLLLVDNADHAQSYKTAKEAFEGELEEMLKEAFPEL